MGIEQDEYYNLHFYTYYDGDGGMFVGSIRDTLEYIPLHIEEIRNRHPRLTRLKIQIRGHGNYFEYETVKGCCDRLARIKHRSGQAPYVNILLKLPY